MGTQQNYTSESMYVYIINKNINHRNKIADKMKMAVKVKNKILGGGLKLHCRLEGNLAMRIINGNGVLKVERVEIKDVRLPLQLQRAMAAEAEAAREARAKVIAAEGEQKASGALKVAAEVIQQSPHALQLRYLQTLTGISTEQSSTIIFPMPISVSSFNPQMLE